jgi:hypothetical protein
MPNANKSIVDITLEFPWKSLKSEWDGRYVYSNVNLVGLVYRGKTLLERFSDPAALAWIKGPVVDLLPTPQFLIDGNEYAGSVDRYERQIELPPGDYDLKIAITNGSDFGRVEIPLSISAPALGNLSISGVTLCKRFHTAADAPLEAERLPLHYIPLMSQGVEFTPAGDTRFRKGDRLILWFQIRTPAHPEPARPPVQFRIIVTSMQTGKVEADSGLQDSTPFMKPGNSTIDIAKEIGFDELLPGAYRVQVQAIDSTGTDTAQSSTTFTVEGH